MLSANDYFKGVHPWFYLRVVGFFLRRDEGLQGFGIFGGFRAVCGLEDGLDSRTVGLMLSFGVWMFCLASGCTYNRGLNDQGFGVYDTTARIRKRNPKIVLVIISAPILPESPTTVRACGAG